MPSLVSHVGHPGQWVGSASSDKQLFLFRALVFSVDLSAEFHEPL